MMGNEMNELAQVENKHYVLVTLGRMNWGAQTQTSKNPMTVRIKNGTA